MPIAGYITDVEIVCENVLGDFVSPIVDRAAGDRERLELLLQRAHLVTARAVGRFGVPLVCGQRHLSDEIAPRAPVGANYRNRILLLWSALRSICARFSATMKLNTSLMVFGGCTPLVVSQVILLAISPGTSVE